MATQTQATVTVRELPPHEFNRLCAFEPFRSCGAPDPSNTRVAVVESAGEIVAFWPVWLAVHVDPCFIAPTHRRRPDLIQGFWGQVQAILQDITMKSEGRFGLTAYTTIYDDDAARVAPMAEKLGFHRIPAALYVVGAFSEKP